MDTDEELVIKLLILFVLGQHDNLWYSFSVKGS